MNSFHGRQEFHKILHRYIRRFYLKRLQPAAGQRQFVLQPQCLYLLHRNLDECENLKLEVLPANFLAPENAHFENLQW